MTMELKDMISLLREDGLNCVAGEMSTGELQYLAADALSALKHEEEIRKYKIECHVETILQYKEENQQLQAENAKLRKAIPCINECSFRNDCPSYCMFRPVKQALAELEVGK